MIHLPVHLVTLLTAFGGSVRAFHAMRDVTLLRIDTSTNSASWKLHKNSWHFKTWHSKSWTKLFIYAHCLSLSSLLLICEQTEVVGPKIRLSPYLWEQAPTESTASWKGASVLPCL